MYSVIQQWRRQGVEDNFNTQGRLKYLLLTPLWDKKFKYHIPGNAFRGNCSDSLNLHLQKTLYFFWQSEILDIEVFCIRDIIHDGRSCQRALEAPCQSIVPYSNMFFEFWNWNWNHLRFPKLKKMYTRFVLVIVRTILGYDGKVVHTQKAHKPHRSPDYNVKHSYSAKYLKLHQIQ